MRGKQLHTNNGAFRIPELIPNNMTNAATLQECAEDCTRNGPACTSFALEIGVDRFLKTDSRGLRSSCCVEECHVEPCIIKPCKLYKAPTILEDDDRVANHIYCVKGT